MKIVVLSKYGDLAASTRQRFLQFRPFAKAQGIELEISALFGNDYLRRIFNRSRKPIELALRDYFSRATTLLRGLRCDAVVVHCEVFPYLPSVAEHLVFDRRRPLIFDSDDAIFHQYDDHRNPVVRWFLGGKLEPLLRHAALAVCGNAYLERYASRFCRRTQIVPTVVDTSLYLPAPDATPSELRPVTIGWIGSPSTWTYVRRLIQLFESLASELNLVIRVVGAGPQADTPPHFEFLEWSEVGEIAMIRSMDVGIMPLPDEPWARGKCGYKLIQYMACGLPVIASPVGVNAEIIDDGVNGMLARSDADWADAIRRLALNSSLRQAMGADGRRKIERKYSLAVHGPRLAGMLRDVIEHQA